MSNSIPACTIVVGIALALVAGCTTMKESYHGHPPTHVWTAMKSVAESPRYDDWHLTANSVWVDEEHNRIEIHRRVDRLLRRPLAKGLREEREWRFQVSLAPQDPPTATFVSRGIGVPMHAHTEAERYFADVWRMLGGAPVPMRSTPPPPERMPEDVTPPEEVQPRFPEIDVLEPGQYDEG